MNSAQNDVVRLLGRRVAQLEAMAKQPASAELRQVAQVATEAAVDGRKAIRVYKLRGQQAVHDERAYRKRQGATGTLLTHLRATGHEVTPPADDPMWLDFRRAMRCEDEHGVPEPDEVWMKRSIPAGIRVGDLNLAKSFEVQLNALCSDARYQRDMSAHGLRSAGKALAMFDRIVNLMQSVMRGDKVEERLTSGLASDLGFDDDDEDGDSPL